MKINPLAKVNRPYIIIRDADILIIILFILVFLRKILLTTPVKNIIGIVLNPNISITMAPQNGLDVPAEIIINE